MSKTKGFWQNEPKNGSQLSGNEPLISSSEADYPDMSRSYLEICGDYPDMNDSYLEMSNGFSNKNDSIPMDWTGFPIRSHPVLGDCLGFPIRSHSCPEAGLRGARESHTAGVNL